MYGCMASASNPDDTMWLYLRNTQYPCLGWGDYRLWEGSEGTVAKKRLTSPSIYLPTMHSQEKQICTEIKEDCEFHLLPSPHPHKDLYSIVFQPSKRGYHCVCYYFLNSDYDNSRFSFHQGSFESLVKIQNWNFMNAIQIPIDLKY